MTSNHKQSTHKGIGKTRYCYLRFYYAEDNAEGYDGKGLLDLPPELRMKIFQYCHVVGEIRVHCQAYYQQNVIIEAPNASSQLLRTCKTALNEGAPILYGENVFRVEECLALEKLTLTIGTPSAACIRNLRLVERGLCTFFPRFRDLQGLSPLSGVRCLDLVATTNMHNIPQLGGRVSFKHLKIIRSVLPHLSEEFVSIVIANKIRVEVTIEYLYDHIVHRDRYLLTPNINGTGTRQMACNFNLEPIDATKPGAPVQLETVLA